MTYPNLQGTALIDGSVGAAPPNSVVPSTGSRLVHTTSGTIFLPLTGYVKLADGSYIATSEVAAGHILIGEIEVPERQPSVHRNTLYEVYAPPTRLPVCATVLTAASSTKAVSSFVPTVYPDLTGLDTKECACVEAPVPLCADSAAIAVTYS